MIISRKRVIYRPVWTLNVRDLVGSSQKPFLEATINAKLIHLDKNESLRVERLKRADGRSYPSINNKLPPRGIIPSPSESRKIGVEATKAAMLSVHGERRNGLTQLSTGMIRLYRRHRVPNDGAAAKVKVDDVVGGSWHRSSLRPRFVFSRWRHDKNRYILVLSIEISYNI